MQDVFFNQDFNFALLKLFFTLGALVYFIYSVVVAKQITVMKKTLITGFSSIINLFGLINLIIAATTLFAFIFFL
jgi:hypothetical protein